MREPKIPGGYILLSRKMIESEIWDKPPLYLKVWIYLLTKAQHSDYRGLKRGQLRVSIPEIMEECSWYVGFRKEKPRKDQVYQVIEWLRSESEACYESETKETMIQTTKATQGMLVEVCNYDYYQNSKNYESNDETNNEEETKATRKQREPNNTNKNDKNVKNENTYDSDFEKFWSSYPNKNGKKPASEKFKVAVKKHGMDKIMRGLNGYKQKLEQEGTAKRYIQQGKTFLNQQTYLDYLEQEKREQKPEEPNKDQEELKEELEYIESTLKLTDDYWLNVEKTQPPNREQLRKRRDELNEQLRIH